MGFSELFSEVLSSLSFTEAHADAPPAEEDSNEDEESKGEGEESTEGGDEDEDKAGGEEAEEEEEEEEEPEDTKPQLEEECANSPQCHDYKHHFEECVDRVTTGPQSQPGYKGFKEDCVEEFFHLQHCATQCAAPKLFRQLK